MNWHLIAPDGAIVRTTKAESKAEARFRLAPVPKSYAVVNAVDYATGYVFPPAAPPPAIRRAENAVLGLRRMQEERPEREAARRQKIAAYQAQLRKRQRQARAEAARQACILRGIERRRAKRQQREGTC